VVSRLHAAASSRMHSPNALHRERALLRWHLARSSARAEDIMPSTTFETIPNAELATPHGGMRYDRTDRESTNVEDRRSPEGKARDQKWFEDNRDMYSPDRPPPAGWRPRPIPPQQFPPIPKG
jgi:hypothetical protein